MGTLIILHAGLLSDDLLLWGESTDPQNRAAAAPDLYPFAASFEELREALGKTASNQRLVKKACRSCTFWLPSKAGQPIASSPLVAEPPRSRAKPRLTPWSLTAYPLSAASAVAFLALCSGRETLAPGVGVGPDLAFWSDALRFAGSIVARQQFLPGVVAQGKTCQARWQPVFAGEDAVELARLARRLPAAARALASAPGDGSPPETAAVEVLESFLGTAVDHLVRSAADEPRKSSRFDSVHDAWFHALRSSDPTLRADADDLNELRSQVETWRRGVVLAVSALFRLSFRLEQPADDGASTRRKDERWNVVYLLQPYDDLSLLVPLSDFWSSGGRTAELERYGSRIRETTLSSLGQAASICPHVASSLETAEPAGYELDTGGAYQFLTEKAALLEQSGFGVLLPAWWTRKGTRTRLGARARVRSPKMQGRAGLTLHDVVRFEWEVALGGEKLTARELEALARRKAPLVKVRGQWVEVDADEIRAAAELWREREKGEATLRDVVRMALGSEQTASGLAIDGVRTSGWIGKMLEQLNDPAALGELATPREFSGTLRPYQTRGYSWLAFLRRWGLGACLADDMGLGKTVQTLVLLQRDWQATDEESRKPVLLICPTSVINNWQKEAARFTPQLPVGVHHGSTRKKKEAFAAEARKKALVLSSYGLLHRDAETLRRVDWAGVVLDEAQNVKNPDTLQARAARSLEAEYRIALTGTPVENHVGDLWSIMEFLNPGFLGSQTGFKKKFLVPIQAERDPEAVKRLKRLTGPFVLRRLKTDKSIITDLPDKQEMKVFCPLTREQASLYRAVVKEVDEALEGAEGMERRGLILATLSKLKQVLNHPAQFLSDNSSLPGRSGKLARLTEMLEEILEVGDRTLVFTQFAKMGGLLKSYLEETYGREVLFLHGGVSRRRRDKMVERFQDEDDAAPIFILSLKAGGTGLNLTRASHVFHFDRWWNPAVEDQATDRAFRIGQRRQVQVHKFLCAGTIEEKIDEMIEVKKGVAREVVGTGEAWLTELSNSRLRDIFRLRKEAVKE